jgi:hypothetical protein
MKTAITLMLCAVLFSCTVDREIQADIVDVQLIKIDTIQRYPNMKQKLLTWRANTNVAYVTYEPMSSGFTIGSKMKMMVTK